MTVDRVILLTVDALGANHVGFHGYKRNTTPHLDKYSKKYLSFDRCISQSSHTRESMFSLFLSTYPSSFNGVGPIGSTDTTLTTILSAKKVATAGFHSNPYLSRAYNFDRGFDTFDDSLLFARNRLFAAMHKVINYFQKRPYRRGERINQMGLSWLQSDRRQSKEFLWLHYMDPHGPYQPPKRFQRDFVDEPVSSKRAKDLWRKTIDRPDAVSEDERDLLVKLYDAEIKYTDHCIFNFISNLKREVGIENTAVIIAADHGELFGKYGLYGHPRYAYHELVHVPLLIISDQVPSKSIDSVVENIDIAPTVLDLLDIDPVRKFAGESIIRSNESRRYAISQASGEKENRGIQRVSVISNEYQYIGEFIQNNLLSESIFDLSGNDPTQIDIANIDQSIKSNLSKAAKNSINRSRDCTEKNNRQLDQSVENRLSELGYK